MKKTIHSILAFAAGVILAGGCAKDISPLENSVTGAVILSASLPGELTKAAVDGTDKTKINWSEGDKIGVWGGENNEFTISSGAGTASAVFSGTVASGTAQYAMSPYNASATASGDIITTNVPNTQTAPAGSFDPSAAILVGTVSGGEISFRHALAYLKITAPDDVDNLIEITIESNGGEQLTGDARFAAADGKFTPTGTPCKYVTIKPLTGTFTADGIYYAAVIPGTYNGGLTVRYIYKDDTNHKLVGKSKSNTTTLEIAAGTAKLLGAATLSTCTSYDAAVQLWADGPYWATTNLGATSETDYGQYFAWGYTEGCVRNSEDSGWELAFISDRSRKFNATSFPDRTAASCQDAAAANWSAGWRLPTAGQLDILVNYDHALKNNYDFSKCSVTPVTEGTIGIRVTGTADGYTGNSIFLPAAGYGSESESSFYKDGYRGYYWSSDLDGSGDAYNLCFYPDLSLKGVAVGDIHKYYGLSVRPVRSSL